MKKEVTVQAAPSFHFNMLLFCLSGDFTFEAQRSIDQGN